jgi:leucyl-tRNA synthetase
MPFNHTQIENKWNKTWSDNNLYRTPSITKGDPKKYILVAFPYPSADGLHVGHPLSYTGADILARYYRATGHAVLQPFGWDAFGLPTENFAKKKGLHPQDVTTNSIKNFKAQLSRLGASYDWDREVNSSSPEYYKWTQWFFQLLYKKGLAYKKEALVNWDPIDKTVLANEQVIDGIAERSGAKVEQKMMNQWFFKITDYADRLIDGLEGLDWPKSTKLMQKNWIGKSIGAEVEFKVADSQDKIRVFTTAHDTIFGTTFLVVAPEHHLVDSLTTDEQLEEVAKYKEKAKQKSQFERTEMNKDKNGVFTGSYAINPINGSKIPVWVADYVLTSYGTGAVMGVPGEDERDFEFATKYDLPIIYTNHTNGFVSYSKEIKPNKTKYTLINSGEFNGMTFEEARQKILDKIVATGSGNAKITYRLRDWSIGRQRYWGCPIPVIYDKDGNEQLVPESDLPVLLPTDLDLSTGMIKPLSSNSDFINSGSKYGEGFTREGDTMDTFVCSSWYFFRYCSGNQTDKFADSSDLKKWAPVDEYIIGAEHTVLHLLYSRFFTKVLFDEGYIDFEEPFLKMRHQGMILGPDNQKMSKSKGNVINPNEVFDEHGSDTLRLYEMFMGPFEANKPWSTESIKGVRRFLDRVYNIQKLVTKDENYKGGMKVETALHKLVKKVGEDIATYSFNTCVSEFMKFVNLVEEIGGIHNVQFGWFLRVLSPFAPFLSEEIWNSDNYHDTSNTSVINYSIHLQPWPKYYPEFLVDSEITIGVQINGKVRGDVVISPTATEEEALALIIDKDYTKRYLEGKEIKKFIYKAGKIINIVIG